MTEASILIVEDEVIVADDIKACLTEMGYSPCAVATSGEEAIQMAELHMPDLVLMDIVLSGAMDGIEAADAIRTKLRLPVIFLSAYGGNHLLERAKITEPFGYLLKPWNNNDLHSTIEMALYKFKIERKLLESEDALRKAHAELEQKVEERTAELRVANDQLRREIVERQRSEEALRVSEEKYRSILESMQEGYFEIDLEGNMVFFNDSFCAITGYGKYELLGKNCNELAAPDAPAPLLDLFNRSMNGAPSHNFFEYRIMSKETEPRILEISSSVISDQAGGPSVFRGVARDVTERKNAEERIHLLTQQLMRAQETERHKISHELHDGVAQDLSALKIAMNTLLDSWPSAPDDLRSRLSDISAILQQSLTGVRDLAYDLRPMNLEQLGLVEAAFQYCEEFSGRTGIAVDFRSAGLEETRLDNDTEISIFRLIQEALNNVRKHAEATAVSIRMVVSYPKLILRIEDNGTGFDVEERMVSALNEKRMGLQSMKERVKLMQGSLKIESRPSKGSKLIMEVPFDGAGGEDTALEWKPTSFSTGAVTE